MKNVLVLLCLFAMVAPVHAEPADQPPNFVIILTDDQGYGDLGYYGS